MLRRIYRGLLDRELGVLGAELDAAETKIDDMTRRMVALQDRFERLVNRVTMRVARAGREDERADRAILDQLAKRARMQATLAEDPFGPDPWHQ
jgi:predicted transcriptional regulator